MPAPIVIPTPVDLLGELEEIRVAAMTRQRIMWQRGIPIEQADPDFNAAGRAVRIKAEICGYIRERPQFETKDLMADVARRLLADPELKLQLLEAAAKLEPGLLVEASGKETK